jgi:hypothetical protein
MSPKKSLTIFFPLFQHHLMCFLTPLPSFPTSFLALGKKSFSNIPSILPSFLDHKNFGDGEQVLSDHNALMNTTSKMASTTSNKRLQKGARPQEGLVLFT